MDPGMNSIPEKIRAQAMSAQGMKDTYLMTPNTTPLLERILTHGHQFELIWKQNLSGIFNLIIHPIPRLPLDGLLPKCLLPKCLHPTGLDIQITHIIYPVIRTPILIPMLILMLMGHPPGELTEARPKGWPIGSAEGCSLA